LGFVITLFWIVGITNAVNLIDGIDGLAGGVSGFIALFLGLIFFYHGDDVCFIGIVLCCLHWSNNGLFVI
jgi:UDP-GlcNAc:undecaprenyl-phosphate GlcNAc-1-phosphate transferase